MISKLPKQEYQQKAYWCNKCKRFHRYKVKGKPIITHKEHFCYFHKFKSDYTQAELFKVDFKKVWKRESNKQREGNQDE